MMHKSLRKLLNFLLDIYLIIQTLPSNYGEMFGGRGRAIPHGGQNIWIRQQRSAKIEQDPK